MMKKKQSIIVSKQLVYCLIPYVHILHVYRIGAPTVEDASKIIIEILDLKHPLTLEQPLEKLLQQRGKNKRGAVTIQDSNDKCPNETKLGCSGAGMLTTT